MTFAIILAVIAGVLAGCSVMPAVFIENTGPVLTAGLCLLLFLVGIDIGRQGTVLKDIRQNGFRILAVPFLVIAGTFAGSAVAAGDDRSVAAGQRGGGVGIRLVHAGAGHHLRIFRRTGGDFFSGKRDERDFCDYLYSFCGKICGIYRVLCSGGSGGDGHLSSRDREIRGKHDGSLQFCVGICPDLYYSGAGTDDYESALKSAELKYMRSGEGNFLRKPDKFDCDYGGGKKC